MGIKGLYQLINKRASAAVTQRSITDFRGQTVGLDGNAFLYTFMYFHNDNTAALANAMRLLGTFLDANGVCPVFVFDGLQTGEEKKRELAARQARRQLTLAKLEQSDKKLAELREQQREQQVHNVGNREVVDAGTAAPPPLVVVPRHEWTSDDEDDEYFIQTQRVATAPPNAPQLSAEQLALQQAIEEQERKQVAFQKQTNKVTPAVVRAVVEQLEADGRFFCFRASGESDFILAHLSRQNLISAACGDDADFLVFGVPVVVRNLAKHKGNQASPLACYDSLHVKRLLRMDNPQFIDMCILHKCDYASKIDNVGSERAYQGIREHRTIERFIKSLPADQVVVKPPSTASAAAASGAPAQPKRQQQGEQEEGKRLYAYEADFLEQVRRARQRFLNPPLSDSDRVQIDALKQFLARRANETIARSLQRQHEAENLHAEKVAAAAATAAPQQQQPTT